MVRKTTSWIGLAAAVTAVGAAWSAAPVTPAAPQAVPRTAPVAASAAAASGLPEAAALAGPRTTAAAGSAANGIPAAAQAEMLRQEPLVAAANIVRPVAEKATAGYSGIALEGDSVVLYFKGAPPAEVTAAVTKARATAPVVVKAAKHSRAELDAATKRILSAPAVKGSQVVQAVEASYRGTGLDVVMTTGVTAPTLPAAGVPVTVVRRPATARPAPGAQRAPAAQRTAARTAVGAQAFPEPGRLNDVAPWWGGAMVADSDSSYSNQTFGFVDDGIYRCTTGFSVRRYVGTVWKVGMLIPAMCGSPGHRMLDGGGTQINNHVDQCACNQDLNHELLVLDMPTAEPFVYDGPAETPRGKPVVGWDPIYPGETLCISAAESDRVMCGLTVEATNVTWEQGFTDSDGDGSGPVPGLVRLKTPTTTVPGPDGTTVQALSWGDEGSPVYSVSGSGVKAKAIAMEINWINSYFTGDVYVSPFSTAVAAFQPYFDLEPLTLDNAP
jgi:streptogrisin D